MLASLYHFGLLVLLLAFFAWRIMHGQSQIEAFKSLTESRDRQHAFITMTVQNFVIFGVGGVAVLAVIGRIDGLWLLPAEFSSVPLGTIEPNVSPTLSRLAGILTGMTLGALAIFVIWRFVLRRKTQPVIGDVDHLFPRNRGEALALVPLTINAGISEEIMFRLALPLVATLATGSAATGIAIAAVTFGLMHWYQGWTGVILTGLISYFFFALYVQTGNLLVPIIIHAVLDLLVVVVRPSISLWLDRERVPARDA